MTSVLFVCTGNMVRSPLAAAFFRRKLQETGQPGDWVVDSAGTWTISGQPIPVASVQAGRKFGVELEGHLTQLIDRERLDSADLILVMEKGHKEALDIEFPFAGHKIRLISEVVDQMTYDIPDPLNPGEEIEIVASDLYKILDRGFNTICQLAQAMQSPRP
jgi:protein-tyrosine phosphatase